jgi:hypothetical protein
MCVNPDARIAPVGVGISKTLFVMSTPDEISNVIGATIFYCFSEQLLEHRHPGDAMNDAKGKIIHAVAATLLMLLG